jgi:hypothetical protein
LRFFALFKRFGFASPYEHETRAIATLIARFDPTITLTKCLEIIELLRVRRLLQGETTLYITPDVLHIRLWSEWWDTYGVHIEIGQLLADLSNDLRKGFFEMFRYARESEIAMGTVTQLLGPGGPLEDDELWQTELGGSFFRALSEADPESALSLLERVLPTWSIERRLGFTTGRRDMINSLEKIAVWSRLFGGAAHMLLLLAEAENESWANNATGIYSGLFCPAPGTVAPTEASPEQRFPALRKALLEGTHKQQSIAIQATRSALSTGPFTRILGSENQGLRPSAQLWSPESQEEHIAAYERVWELLIGALPDLADDLRDSAVQVLLDQTSSLAPIPGLCDRIPNDVRNLVDCGFATDRQVVTEIADLLHYRAADLSDDVLESWKALYSDLAESSFHAQLRRFVGTSLISDLFTPDGERTDYKKERIEALADEAIKDTALLIPELRWLVTTEAEAGHHFGYELGLRDKGLTLLAELVAAQRDEQTNASLLTLSGYIRAAASQNAEECTRVVEELSREVETVHWAFELIWRSHLVTDRTKAIVRAMLSSDTLTLHDLRTLGYSGFLTELDQDEIEEWVEILLAENSLEKLIAALAFISAYIGRGELAVSSSILAKLLLHRKWILRSSSTDAIDRNDDWTWCTRARELLTMDGNCTQSVVRFLVASFGGDGILSIKGEGCGSELLSELAQAHPELVWDVVSKKLEGRGRFGFWVQHWLMGSDAFGLKQPGAIALFSKPLVWAWVERQVDSRAPLIASLAPKDLLEEDSFSRDVLERYGSNEEVLRALAIRHGNTGWKGSESEHFSKIHAQYAELRERETEPRAKEWLDAYLENLDRSAKRARIEEERDR